MTSLLEKIRSRGYWQIIVRPSAFRKNRIEDINELLPILESARVALRGWDFPHIDYQSRPEVMLDWIGQETDREQHKEIWRFYQSGLFAYIGSIAIDWRDESNWWPADEKWKPGTQLGIGATAFRFIEIFEFASRLALTKAGDDQMHIEVTLGNIKSRTLYVDERKRWPFFQAYTSSIEEFPYRLETSKSNLISDPRNHALDATHELFKRFDWKITRDELAQFQNDLFGKST